MPKDKEKDKVICSYCDKEFKNEAGLNIHKSRQHKKEIKKEQEKQKKEKKKQQERKEKKLKKAVSNKMPDHIEEYFKDQESSKEAVQSRELFTADKENIDLKTDIDEKEIRKIATLLHNNKMLKDRGLKPVFNNYLYKLMRLKVSKDRKSRSEFVGLNSQEIKDELNNLNKNLSPLTKPRK